MVFDEHAMERLQLRLAPRGVAGLPGQPRRAQLRHHGRNFLGLHVRRHRTVAMRLFIKHTRMTRSLYSYT